ncbi:MAG: hypothetical protein J5896_06240 [Alphaproteobacteria bacterium]|nr:hypothetical protein [Alphaproteobacteria bacterium]
MTATIITIIVGVLLVIALIVKCMFIKIQQLPLRLFDVFLEMPTADELLKLSIDELRQFSKRKLGHLEDIALLYKKIAEPEDKVSWDDVLRRIDIALNGF